MTSELEVVKEKNVNLENEKESLERDGAQGTDLQDKVLRLENELARLEQSNRDLENANEVFSQSLWPSHGSLTIDKAHIEAEQTSSAELQSLRLKSAEFAQCASQIVELETQCRKLRESLELAEAKCKDKELNLAQTSSQLVQKQDELSKLTETVKTLQEQKTKLDKTVLALKRDKEDLEKERTSLNDTNKALSVTMNSKIEQLQSAASAQGQTQHELEATTTTLKKQAEADKKELEELRAFKSSAGSPDLLKKKVETLSRDCQIQRKMIEDQKEQIRKLHLETVSTVLFDGLDADYKLIKNKLSAKIAEIKALKETASGPNQAEIEALRTERNTLQTSLEAERSVVSILNNKLEQLKQEFIQYKSSQAPDQRIMELQQSLDQLRKQYDQQLSMNTQNDNKIKELQQSITSLMSERDTLKSSTQAGAQATEIPGLRAQISNLKAERDQLKEDLRVQSASNAFGFTMRGKNRALSCADINAELRYAKECFPSYKLGGPLKPTTQASGTGTSSGPEQDAAETAGSSSAGRHSHSRHTGWGTARIYSPYVKRRMFLDSGSDTEDDTGPRFRGRGKGKGKGKGKAAAMYSSDSDSESSESSSQLIL
ncbi:hypothetical protein C8R42DRAFT_640217 [Lentinula raphanica]|nr:hypothetical protein C8R42DRAFT_640217 [Lentinula raphanica]